MKQTYNFNEQHVLVIGDSILDVNIFCESIGLALETPTMKGKYLYEETTFGGAANVVNNLLSLGCKVTFITLVAKDSFISIFNNWEHVNLNKIFLIKEGENCVKTRYWINRGEKNYKYLQVNRGTKMQILDSDIINVSESINAIKSEITTTLLVDYKIGLFNNKITVSKIIQMLKSFNLNMIASSQISDGLNNYSYFEGANCYCMNYDEAKANLKTFQPNSNGIRELSEILKANICVTLGKQGSILKYGDDIIEQKAFLVNALDTCGAGDAFLAAFCLTYETKSLEFCSVWAGLSTLKIGTNSPSLDEINAVYKERKNLD